MAVERVSIETFLSLVPGRIVLDVRSPSEYRHAHIPGAYSLPLFTDEERKIVGTAYKQECREKAIKIGLDFFGPKMSKMIEEVEKLSNPGLRDFLRSATEPQPPGIFNNDSLSTQPLNPSTPQLLIYCWRGGMRSAGVAWLMDLYGFKVYTLAGGYKKFRNYVLDSFSRPYRFNILGGFTGSAKTELIRSLKEKGKPAIDLEGIANHKGSAFGNIGMPPQPGQEMFENILSRELDSLKDTNEPVWLEDESQRIGLVNIPNELWKTMRNSPVYFLDIPFEQRLQHIVEEYGQLDRQKLIDAILRIREKLGGLNAKTAIQLLEEGNTLESFRILLNYYDKLYHKSLHNRESINSLLCRIPAGTVSNENTNLLINASSSKLQEI